jgi:sterol desaturase/sphingolipid hydroxylase (fatty acid hydroxylase superfamily)
MTSRRTMAENYLFWLVLISIGCFVLERIRPWRRQQPAFRAGFLQDLFWLFFNGHFVGIAIAVLACRLLGRLEGQLNRANIPTPESVHLLGGSPPWIQFLVFLVVKDFLDWCVHNLLHRVSWLWELHKLHHSIEALDFLGNLRFHWMESVIYKALTYLPLVVLGVDGHVILAVAIVDTLIGHLNHANVKLDWGPLRYVLNSPRMHVWHHEVLANGSHGKNFGVVLSVWDFLFGTAHLPSDDQPEKLGFAGIERFPRRLLGRLTYPLVLVIGGR